MYTDINIHTYIVYGTIDIYYLTAAATAGTGKLCTADPVFWRGWRVAGHLHLYMLLAPKAWEETQTNNSILIFLGVCYVIVNYYR